jgi:hypothetical protein
MTGVAFNINETVVSAVTAVTERLRQGQILLAREGLNILHMLCCYHLLVIHEVSPKAFDFFRNTKDQTALRAFLQRVLSRLTVHHAGRAKGHNVCEVRRLAFEHLHG